MFDDIELLAHKNDISLNSIAMKEWKEKALKAEKLVEELKKEIEKLKRGGK